MIAWLTDTLLYTGALIALVLVLRRPVARHFGAQMSYALWALPLLRFIMPPVVLPASLAPQRETVTSQTTTTITMTVDGVPVVPPVSEVTYVVEPTFWEAWGSAIVGAALFAWLAGAALFLLWRCWTYFRMREWLLDGARPVGEAGKVRLVESPAVTSPVAFGVSDKVVALPVGFMASENRAARDLAIEHELAHHRGWDLLANILAQPILALHWFNPLAWMGWRAMRRDQEAACDARVIAHRDPCERAAYGHVIASFASGQRLSLAAPMACPVLGEKSIIHRLRSLSMSDISPRRRMAGRVLLAGAALALPLTASISYAQPDAPKAPRAPKAAKPSFTIIDVPEGADPSDKTLHTKVIEQDGQTIILKTAKPLTDAEAQASVERAQASMAAMSIAPVSDIDRQRAEAAREHWAKFGDEMAKHGEEWAKQGREWAKQDKAWEEWGDKYGQQWEEWGKQQAAAAQSAPFTLRITPAPATPPVPSVAVTVQVPQAGFGCDPSGKPVLVRSDSEAAKVERCRKIANTNARRALIQARASIARNRSMDEATREDVLESLDEQIDRLEEDHG